MGGEVEMVRWKWCWIPMAEVRAWLAFGLCCTLFGLNSTGFVEAFAVEFFSLFILLQRSSGLLSGLRFGATMCPLGMGEATRSYLSSRPHLSNLDQAMAMLEMHRLAISPGIRTTELERTTLQSSLHPKKTRAS